MTDKKKDVFDSSQITGKELQKYEKNFSEEGLLHKLTQYGKSIGVELLYKAAQLWFVMQRPDVPAATKALIMGALGYLISPLDFIPDLTPVLGYSDDLVAITFALIRVQGYIDENVRRQARNFLSKIFGQETVQQLENE
ncbi:MAG: YkvA family protein [Phascolarctobacterium sp.]|uniref:YkvA family protein n=1 Tax=Phascolarctobacterium sp. TaxID=2049039 RepID=UPI0026DBDC17|nr:YkvA family protein [Phascolarctobacterium sp.]MDO4922224.1 YkvA family protein [Phascolarctobacterium sp.]